MGKYFDDLAVGEVWRTAALTVTEAAIIAFAGEWDSQPFHVDQIAATDSVFGALVGSGLQTVMLSYRLYHTLQLLQGTALAGLGIDRIRFHAPLRPGETIHVVVKVAELRTTSRPDRGIVVLDFVTRDHAMRTLMTLSLTALVARRSR